MCQGNQSADASDIVLMVLQSTQPRSAWVRGQKGFKNKENVQELSHGILHNADISGASVSQRLAAVLRAEGASLGQHQAPEAAYLRPLPVNKHQVDKHQALDCLPCEWKNSFGELPAPPKVPPALPRNVREEFRLGVSAASHAEHGGSVMPASPWALPSAPVSVLRPRDGVQEGSVAKLLAKQQRSTVLMEAFNAWAGLRLQRLEGALMSQQQLASSLQSQAASQEENMAAMERLVLQLWKQEARSLKETCMSACQDVAGSLVEEVRQTKAELIGKIAESEGKLQLAKQQEATSEVSGRLAQERIEKAVLEARLEQRQLQLLQLEKEKLDQNLRRADASSIFERELQQSEDELRRRVAEQQLKDQQRRADRAALDLTSEVVEAARRSAVEEARRCVASGRAELEQLHQRESGKVKAEILSKAKEQQEEFQREVAKERRRLEELRQQEVAARERQLQEREEKKQADRAALDLTREVVAVARQSAAEEARRCVESRGSEQHQPTTQLAQLHRDSRLEQASEELTSQVISTARQAAREESARWAKRSSQVGPVAGAEFGLDAPAPLEDMLMGSVPNTASGISGHGTFVGHIPAATLVEQPASIAPSRSMPSLELRYPMPGAEARRRREQQEALAWQEELALEEKQRLRAERIAKEHARERELEKVAEQRKFEQMVRVERARLRREEMLAKRSDKVRSAREQVEERHSRMEQASRERFESVLAAKAAAAREESALMPPSNRPVETAPRSALLRGGSKRQVLPSPALNAVSDRLFSILDSDNDGVISQEQLTEATVVAGQSESHIMRDEVNEVIVDKRFGELLGLEYLVEEDCLLIEAVRPGGLIETWNQEHQDQQVHVGDRIVGVNRCDGDGESILTELRKATQLRMRLRPGYQGQATISGVEEVDALSYSLAEEFAGEPHIWKLHEAAGMSPPQAGADPVLGSGSGCAAVAGSPESDWSFSDRQAASDTPLPPPGPLARLSREGEPPREAISTPPVVRGNNGHPHASHPPPLVHRAQPLSCRPAQQPEDHPGPSPHPHLAVVEQAVDSESQFAFPWPSWALDPNAVVEVFVEADAGGGTWVRGVPRGRALDEGGQDALLTVQYPWQDGEVYEEEFAPHLVRRPHSQ
mmetsp:Transcript_58799/g.140163  ORF Transcript_58799/g.140163 Transcript_58799/m.140163 type:complete len:1123 (+) Transcript_58799:102-3470(+)